MAHILLFINNFISIKPDLPGLSYIRRYEDLDLYYLNNGDYYQSLPLETPDYGYPFFSLFSGKTPLTPGIEVEENKKAGNG